MISFKLKRLWYRITMPVFSIMSNQMARQVVFIDQSFSLTKPWYVPQFWWQKNLNYMIDNLVIEYHDPYWKMSLSGKQMFLIGQIMREDL